MGGGEPTSSPHSGRLLDDKPAIEAAPSYLNVPSTQIGRTVSSCGLVIQPVWVRRVEAMPLQPCLGRKLDDKPETVSPSYLAGQSILKGWTLLS